MDIDLSEEQEMLKRMARDFLADKCPGTLVRELMEDEQGHPPDLWREISDLGWLGLVFPEQYGGGDMGFLDLAVLLEEMGRVAFPGPFFSTVVLGGMPILHMGSEEQKRALLPKLCKGELLATLALVESDTSFDSSGIKTQAVPNGESYVLSGTKMFVPNANVADLIVCVAQTSNGITVFLVDGNSTGLECNVLKMVDGSKQCELTFNNVKVPKKNILGDVDKGWKGIERVIELAAVAKCAEMLGGAQRVLDMSIHYTAEERQQFGRFIGSFQAIQHHCANMAIDVDGMRLTTYQAAWMLNEGLPCRREVAVAKAWASDAFKRVTLTGLRVHGGVGFMEDHDISIFYRKARTSESDFGNADFHRHILCQELNLV